MPTARPNAQEDPMARTHTDTTTGTAGPSASDPVRQVVPLGMHWPTVDPFLFCAHHDDPYPEGDERLAPAASLAGRRIGQDFDGVDGWNMYHGTVVPGFPQHPHRGFETVTFVRQGLIDHADSLGAAARFGRGDVQWVTAGRGIVHSEMFPLLERERPNPVELFQIWLNLPAADKMAEPHFTMLWGHDVPVHTVTGADGRRVDVTVLAGELAGLRPPAPPPDSWAAHPEADVAIWHLRLDPGTAWEMPPARGADTVRTVYLFEGDGAHLGDRAVPADHGALVRSDVPVVVRAGDTEVEALVLQGRPIGEPVAQYGPFVLNDEAGIEQAFADYRQTGFGGWPWPADDPDHGPHRGRFARHADGRLEEPDGSAA
jgi:redox-sensitive bicupin YhaK (pirin superfamily)